MFFNLDAAVRTANVAGRAGEGLLHIGTVASISTSFLHRLIREWMAKHPRVAVDIVEGSPREHIAAVIDRRLDIAFVSGSPSVAGCDVEHMWSEPLLAAVQSQHRFAGRGVVELDEAASEPFIVSKVAPGPELHDFIVGRFTRDGGSRPSISLFSVGREMLMSMVGLGFGTTLVSGAEAGVIYPGVVFVPVAGESLSFSAVWSPDNDNPALRRFLSLARMMAKDSNPSDQSHDERA